MLRRLLLLPMLLAPSLAAADEVRLKGGTRLEGVVLAQDDVRVRLLLPSGVEQEVLAGDVAEVVRERVDPKASRSIRWTESADGKAALQVPVITLVKDGAPRVDLVGAVHIADRSFFHEVQALLERADLVLYEMVKPKEMAPDAVTADGKSNPIRDFQARMGKTLGLKFQLEEITYTRPHFVNADLTPEELFGNSKEPLISPGLMMIFKIALSLLERQTSGDSADAKASRDRLRRLLGKMLGEQGDKMGALLGAEVAENLLGRRNAAVVERLKQVPGVTAPTTGGDAVGNVAIFYGAAHLPDLEKRITELGYRRAGTRWLDAWKIP